MDKELKKRLEEAAVTTRTEIINEIPHAWLSAAIDKATRQGFEYGYNEAITQAKEWWKDHYKLPDYYHSETRDVQEKMRDNYEFHMKVVADFESDMNKLWEEKK